MESLGDFFGVAFVVEGEETVEDFAAGGFADGEADTLFGFSETIVKTNTKRVIQSDPIAVSTDIFIDLNQINFLSARKLHYSSLTLHHSH